MSRKRIPELENLEIQKFAAEGKCIGYYEDRVVFIPYTAPGDIVNARVFKKKKNFLEARVTKYVKKSELRVAPKCEHFGICGGCKWQHLPYELQTTQKEKQVREQLEKIGKVEVGEYLPILNAEIPYGYRNKVEFSFSHEGWIVDTSDPDSSKEPALGFHVPGRFDKVLAINYCHLVNHKVNDILKATQDLSKELNIPYYNIREHEGLLRNLTIRNSNKEEYLLIFSITEFNDPIDSLFQQLLQECPFITSLNYVLNNKKNDTIFDLDVVNYFGKDTLEDQIGEIKYNIRPKSFFQTNIQQVKRLYDAAISLADLRKQDIVYDLYTGTGSIALYVSGFVSKVVGIEILPQAIEDAKQNALNNDITNCEFLVGDMKKAFNSETTTKYGVPDYVITDPPRNGMDKEVIAELLQYKPRQILYISCNPATQARDLALLDEVYRVEKSQAVDMFPQTHHVENIVLLGLKD